MEMFVVNSNFAVTELFGRSNIYSFICTTFCLEQDATIISIFLFIFSVLAQMCPSMNRMWWRKSSITTKCNPYRVRPITSTTRRICCQISLPMEITTVSVQSDLFFIIIIIKILGTLSIYSGFQDKDSNLSYLKIYLFLIVGWMRIYLS